MASKQKAFDVRNFIKSENGRLSSLTLPRDLSLGGNKQKKVYKPNLNVVRNKNKPKEVVVRTQNQQRRNARNAQNNRHNQSQQKYVQSVGVFSEGTAEVKRPRIHSDRYLNFSKDQDASYMVVPKVAQNNWDIDVKEESLVIDELLGEEDSSSENECEYGPIMLPLSGNRDNFVDTFKAKKEEAEVKVKEEVNDKSEAVKPVVNAKYEMPNGCNTYVPIGLKESKLYDDERPCISLIKMPDSLPGKGYEEDSDKPVDYNLNQMNEGKIGKVLIRKSGKIEVYIGRTKYILDVVDASPFKEALMSIPENMKTTSGHPDMVDLGNIDEKYILSPSWKNLFHLKNNTKKS